MITCGSISVGLLSASPQSFDCLWDGSQLACARLRPVACGQRLAPVFTAIVRLLVGFTGGARPAALGAQCWWVSLVSAAPQSWNRWWARWRHNPARVGLGRSATTIAGWPLVFPVGFPVIDRFAKSADCWLGSPAPRFCWCQGFHGSDGLLGYHPLVIPFCVPCCLAPCN